MKKIKFTILGMDSISEELKIRNLLEKQAGIEIVKANHKSGKIVIVFDENQIKNLNFKKLISKLGNFQIKEAEKTDETQEMEAKTVKKSNNPLNTNSSFGLYYGNTFITGVLVGLGLMSLLLNIILLSILSKN